MFMFSPVCMYPLPLPPLQIVPYWTGPNVISETITVAHIRTVQSVLQRRPIIWDNLHANDYDNGVRTFLGPYSGREAGLLDEVEGILTNPNCEFETNFIPIHTLCVPQHKPTLQRPTPAENYRLFPRCTGHFRKPSALRFP